MTMFPQTPAATAALSVAARFYTPALLNHCVRSYLWGATYAAAHGIAGNRLFPGTVTFDDPAVADEAVLPDFSSLNRPAQGSNVVENRIN